MDSDEETVFLTQNTFSQEPFSPELNLEELLADFREVSERNGVEVQKKENRGILLNALYQANYKFEVSIFHVLNSN